MQTKICARIKESTSETRFKTLHFTEQPALNVQSRFSFQAGRDTINVYHRTTEQTNKNDTPERILRAVIVKGRRGIQLAGNQRLLTRSKHTKRNPRGSPLLLPSARLINLNRVDAGLGRHLSRPNEGSFSTGT